MLHTIKALFQFASLSSVCLTLPTLVTLMFVAHTVLWKLALVYERFIDFEARLFARRVLPGFVGAIITATQVESPAPASPAACLLFTKL